MNQINARWRFTFDAIIALAILGALDQIVFAANDLSALGSPEIEVRYHPGDKLKAERIVIAAENGLQRMRDELGLILQSPVTVVLARGEAEFQRYSGGGVPEWAIGIARSGADAGEADVVIDATRSDWDLPNNILLVFLHELCHAALAQAEADAGENLPRWFHEGVAAWLTGARLGIDRRDFDDAAGAGKLIPLAQITADFPSHGRDANLAYLESEEFINYILSRTDKDVVQRILREFASRKPFPDAFAAVVGYPLAAMEKEWAAAYVSSHPFLDAMLRRIPLFGLMAAGCIIIFLVVRNRAKRRQREWEEEERLLYGGDAADDGDEEDGEERRSSNDSDYMP